jgi:hypothetical protein
MEGDHWLNERERVFADLGIGPGATYAAELPVRVVHTVGTLRGFDSYRLHFSAL